MMKIIFKKNFYLIFTSLLVYLLGYSHLAIGNTCEELFGSRLFFERKVKFSQESSKKLHPTHVDIMADKHLQDQWNKTDNTPVLLERFLPKDVYFIEHQLYQPGSPSSVKVGEPGYSVMARAKYNYQGRDFHTNVLFSTRAILSNMNGEDNWLVSQGAKAAILFLHGGGTKSTGSHVASSMLNHFKNYGIDVLALDLPWHSQGHREFVDLETDVRILGNFVQKYIPPNVPLFVMGHSWGGVFAEKIMQMTEKPGKDFFFHRSLRGTIILSTAVDPAPGKSVEEKSRALLKRQEEAKALQDRASQPEVGLWKNIIYDGKIAPLASFYTLHSILSLDQTLPTHKGSNYIPALMVVGKGDPLVYIGYEDIYENYKSLANVETHYLEELPIYNDNSRETYKVGHMLADFADPATKQPIQFVLSHQFILKQLFVYELINQLKTIIRGRGDKEISLSELVSHLSSKIHQSIPLTEVLKDVDKVSKLKAALGEEFINGDTKISIDSLLISIPIIGGIYLDNFVKSDIKKAHKEELNDYIRVVQEYANNLAFRLFLLSYNNKQNKKNINFKEAREKQQRIREKFIEVATPYIPLYRVQSLLQNIINIEDIKALHDLKSEIKAIMEENYLNSLNHNQLKDELLLLGVALSIAIKVGPHSSDRLLTSLLKKRTQIVLEKYNKYVREREVKVKKSRPSYELVKIIDQKEVTLKEVLAFIDGEQLPNEAKLKLYDLAKQYFVMKDIIDGKYIPSEEIKIPRLLDKEGRVQIRVNRILSQLEINIRSREGIVAQETKAYTELKTLTAEYKQLLQQVKTHLKNIKRALADAQINVPDSLRSDYDKSNKEFETVLEEYKQMDERLSQISTRLLNQQLSNHRIDQIFTPEDKIVMDSFIEIFSNYVNNRHRLKEKLIVAIENGEKGEDLQRSVISIYGKGSGGVKPILGSRSVYVQLQEVVLKIAKIESDIVDYSRQIVELTMEYNNLLRTLISLMPEALSTKPEIKRLIRAAGINNPEIIYMQDVLAGFFVAGSKELEDKNSAIEYIKAHNTMFSAALKQWNKLISRLPDDLPTEQ